jgi:oligopeptide transport system substrate-binding protein
MYAYLLLCIQNAQAITRGKLSPERLAVRALDDFSLQVDLRSPTPFFLELLSVFTLFPVPRLAIERVPRGRNENSWTEPKNIVTSGPFTLREHRSRDRIVVERNTQYYDAPTVALEQVSFLLTQETTVGANLYKSGRAHLMPGFGFPPLVAPALSRKRDLCTSPAFGTAFPCFNTTKPPFDNVLVRYALNMAVNKHAIADVFGFGRQPARNLVPSLPGYRSPESVQVRVNGKSYDVLQFNPEAARELLAFAGFPGGRDTQGNHLTLDMLCPNFQEPRLRAEILQSEWQDKLSIRVNVNAQEFKLFLQNISSLNYQGVTDNWIGATIAIPPGFWTNLQAVIGQRDRLVDPQFDSLLAQSQQPHRVGSRGWSS